MKQKSKKTKSTKKHAEKATIKKTCENSVFIDMNKEDFDAILYGPVNKLYRTISDDTAKQFLKQEEVNGELQLVYDPNLVSEEQRTFYGVDLCYYNDGKFPFIPKDLELLDLIGHYNRRWDIMTIRIKNISFEPMKDEEGRSLRLSYNQEGDFVKDENGKLTVWLIVFHLGKIERKHLMINEVF